MAEWATKIEGIRMPQLEPGHCPKCKSVGHEVCKKSNYHKAHFVRRCAAVIGQAFGATTEEAIRGMEMLCDAMRKRPTVKEITKNH